MNARHPFRAPLRLATLLAAGAAVACVSSHHVEKIPPAAGSDESRLIATSPSFLNGVLEKPGPAGAPSGVHAVAANGALAPDDPWLGAVGWKTPLARDTEIGLGVCVPGSSSTRNSTAVPVDRARAAGAGLWLKLDF